MKQVALFFMFVCFYPFENQGIAQPNSINKLAGVFDGRTPCRDLAKLLDEKTTPDCIKIKWRLMLFVDSLTGTPGTYSLIGFVYKKNNPRTGNWQISKGTFTDPGAMVYQLNMDGGAPIFLQVLDNNILYFLDKEKKLLVGNRDFSYTLNRVKRSL